MPSREELEEIASSDAPPEERREARIKLDELEEESEPDPEPDFGGGSSDDDDDSGGSSSSSSGQDYSDQSLREGLEEVAQGGGRAARQAGAALTDIEQNNYNEQLALDDRESLQNELSDRGINDGIQNVVASGDPSEGEDVVSRGTGDTMDQARTDAAKNPNVDFDADTDTGRRERRLGTNQPLSNIQGSQPEAVQNKLEEIAGSNQFQGNRTGRQAGAIAQAIQRGQDEFDSVDIQTQNDRIQVTGRNQTQNQRQNNRPDPRNILQNNTNNQDVIQQEDIIQEDNFNGRQTRTDFASSNSFTPPPTEGEQYENSLEPLSNSQLRQLGIETNTGKVTVSENENQGIITELFGEETIERAKENNPGLDVYDASPASPDQGSISTGPGIPDRDEFIQQNAGVTTAFEMNPGFYTAQEVEGGLENAGVDENAADTFGNTAGVATMFGADTLQAVANPGETAEKAAQAASNPAAVIDSATTEKITPYRTTEQRKFQNAADFGEALTTVTGVGRIGKGASTLGKIDNIPDGSTVRKTPDSDFSQDDLFALNDNTDLGKPGKDGYTPAEIGSIASERLAQEVRGVTAKKDAVVQAASNFKDRTGEILRKADPSTGIGRERRPGEETATSLDLAKQRTQDLENFIKGDIDPDRTRRPEAREVLLDEGVTVRGRQKVDAIVDDTQLSGDADRIIVDSSSEGLSRAGNIPIELREKNRRDILISKGENLIDDINERMNSGPVGSGPGALLKQKDLVEDKTPDTDTSIRLIDDQDRRQDVEGDSLEDRILRDRDRDRRRNDRTEFNKPRTDSSIDDALLSGQGLGLAADQGVDSFPVSDQDQGQGQTPFQETFEDVTEDQTQDSDSILTTGSDTDQNNDFFRRREEDRQDRPRDPDRNRRRDTDLPDIDPDSDNEQDKSVLGDLIGDQQDFQFTESVASDLLNLEGDGKTSELSAGNPFNLRAR